MATPRIKVIPTSFQDVLGVLQSEALRGVERAIAARTGMEILEDYSPAATSGTLAEMSVSGLTAAEIEALLRSHGDQITAFGARLLRAQEATGSEEEYPEGEDQDPSGQSETVGLGAGFGVKYAIYYSFLSGRTPEELRAFLANRRIPRAARFARELRRVFEEACGGGA